MINKDDLWRDSLTILSGRVQAISFEVWIAKLKPVCFLKNKLVLLTNSPSSKNTIMKNYLPQITAAVKEVNPAIEDVEIILEGQKEEYLKKQEFIVNEEWVVEDSKPVIKDNGFSFTKKYTFDSFVVGNSNQLAFAAAKAVADDPGSKFNPLFLYGGVGLGKTHLMHAIGNYIKDTNQNLRIMYITADKFRNDYIDAINKRTTQEFREKYRQVDVIMIDDIQSLSNSPASQEAVFHMFNDLYQNDKQIILSSDRPPKEISQLEERLRTRFQLGLQEKIDKPDLETRIAILKRKASGQTFNLSDEVAYFIAKNVEDNVREMEGLLNKVIFYSSLSGSPVTTIAAAQEALKDSIKLSKDSIDENDIINTTCQYFGISYNDIVGKRRNKEFVEPRMIAIYLIRDILNMPLQAIGELFGGRDHTTIINARDKVSEALKTDKKTKMQVKDIQDMLYKR